MSVVLSSRLVVRGAEHQPADATGSNRLGDGVQRSRVHTLGKFKSLAFDRVRKVLGNSIVEIEQVATAVLGVSRTLPDRLDALTHAFRHDLGFLEAQQDAIALFLRDLGLNHVVEQGSRLLKRIDGTGKRITQGVSIQRLGVLAGHADSRNRKGKAIRADQADEANLERGSKRPVKGILHLQAEGKVVAIGQLEPVVGEVVDGTDAGSAVRANGLTLKVGETSRLEEVFRSTEHVGVLEDFIAVGNATEDFTVVRADIGKEAGGRAVGQVKRDLFNGVVELFRLTLNGFGGGGGEVDGHVFFGLVWLVVLRLHSSCTP